MSSNIDLQLHPWRVFHGGDEIRGTIKIDFLSSIEVKNIQVKLVGISKSQFTEYAGQASVHYEETHDIVYDVITIFPPPDMEGVMQSSTYKMLEGKTLESQFNFTLPFTSHCGDPESRMASHFNSSKREQGFASSNHNKDQTKLKYHVQGSLLAPSFKVRDLGGSTEAEVKYFIKVTIRKPHVLAMNIRKEFPISVSIPPPDPFPFDDQVMVVSDTISLSKNKNGSHRSVVSSIFRSSGSKFILNFKFALLRPRFIVKGQMVQLKVILLSDTSPYEFMDDSKKSEDGSGSNGMGIIYLKKYELRLKSSARCNCEGAVFNIDKVKDLDSNTNVRELDLAKMVLTEELPDYWMYESYASKYALDISEHFGEVCFANITPTFQSCNINYTHVLELKLKLGTSPEGWTSTKSLLQHKCVLVGSFPREQKQDVLPEYSA